MLLTYADPQDRESLEQWLTEWGLDFVSTPRGDEAWDITQSQNVWLVITEWERKSIDGLDLCRKIREEGFPFYIYIILLTPKNHRNDLMQGTEAGADDFLIKPFTKQQFKARVMAARRIISAERELEEHISLLQKTNRELIEAYDIIQKDLYAAARIQQSLLPVCPQNIHGFRFHAQFVPARLVCGDIYNFFPVDADHVACYLLDVAGHGIPAAMLSMAVAKTITSLPFHETMIRRKVVDAPEFSVLRPGSVVHELNTLFQSNDSVEQYFTMVYAVLERNTGKVRFTQAGHPHPILVPRQGPAGFVGEGGLPVGLLRNAEFSESEITLAVGDRLFLYSDGITEATNADGEMFTSNRLADLLVDNRSLSIVEILDLIQEAVAAFRGSEGVTDDMSLLAIERVDPMAGS